MQTFLIMYASDFEGNDDSRPYISSRSFQAESRAFTLLASVSSCWHYSLSGWPQSPTGHWLRHQLKKLIERECWLPLYLPSVTKHIRTIFNCNCNWGTCIAPPTRRPRAHHRVNPYRGAHRQNETKMFSDHDKTSLSIAAVSAPSRR